MVALSTHTVSTPLGILRLTGTETVLHGIDITTSAVTAKSAAHAVLDRAAGQLDAYINNRPYNFADIPLNPESGTAFQRQVWAALRSIPHGHTVSYAALAARIGRPNACRAVAQACGANPFLLVVPCHRVIEKNGQPGGFAYGVNRKKWLLNLEHAHLLKMAV